MIRIFCINRSHTDRVDATDKDYLDFDKILAVTLIADRDHFDDNVNAVGDIEWWWSWVMTMIRDYVDWLG